ncbi:NAD-dependent protein deacylase [Bacillus paranthracis]
MTEVRKNFGSIIKKYFKLIRFINISQIVAIAFLAELEEKGKDITILTQNIDGLHQVGGSKHVIDLHGTLQTAHCPKCKTGYDLQYMIDQEVPRCEKCNFILNPDVVLYGDTLPQYQNAIKRLYETDVLLVMGTSLKVQPVASFPQIAKREVGATTILVNEELTGQEYNFDYVFQNKIGEFVDGLSSRK